MAQILEYKKAATVEEIEYVFKKYGLSISHEDGHGSFIIESFSENNISWLRKAGMDIPTKKSEGEI